jgi:hypothetical protein
MGIIVILLITRKSLDMGIIVILLITRKSLDMGIIVILLITRKSLDMGIIVILLITRKSLAIGIDTSKSLSQNLSTCVSSSSLRNLLTWVSLSSSSLVNPMRKSLDMGRIIIIIIIIISQISGHW